MDEYVVAFIVARLSSSRLPNKHLKKIGNKRLIDWTIENVKKSKYIDKIVIATTDDKENENLFDVAKGHNVDIYFYKGDINDVVGRLTEAANVYNADVPILISGDCPLIYAKSLDKLIHKIKQNSKLDNVCFCNKNGKSAIHEGMIVYRKKCWELANKLSDKPNLREHQFPIIGLKPELFNTDCVFDEDIFYKIKHRISVDTLADLEFMNQIYDELINMGKSFNLLNVVYMLLDKPELMEINKNVHQMKIDEKQKKSLFIVKHEDNLEIFFKLAYELTKQGIGVMFLIEDDNLKNVIEKSGFCSNQDVNKKKYDIIIEG